MVKNVCKYLFYAISIVFVRGANILLAPLIMRVVSPHDYGVLALFVSGISIASVILGLGLRQVLSLDFFHCDANKQRMLVGCMVTLYTIIATIVCFVAFLGAPYIEEYYFMSAAPMGLAPCMILIIWASFFIELLYQLLSYYGYTTLLSAIHALSGATLAGLNLLFLFCFGFGMMSSVISQTIVSIILFSGAATVYCCWGVPISLAMMKQSYWYIIRGLPFVPSVLCGWILASADRIILARAATLHEVGIYSVADYACQLFAALILQPMSVIYLPPLMRKFSQGSNFRVIEHENRRIMIMSMVGLSACMVVGYYTLKPLALFILPVAYNSVPHYAFILVCGQLFLLGSYFANALVQYERRVDVMIGSLASAAILNMILNLLTVKTYGIMGCAVSTAISYIWYFAYTFYFNCRLLQQRDHAMRAIIPARSQLDDRDYGAAVLLQTNQEHSTQKR